MHEPLTVLFAGIQGCGKGTQAALLKQFLEVRDEHKRPVLMLGMGDLLRNFVQRHTNTLSRRIKETMETGGLLPSFVPNYVLNSYLTDHYTPDSHVLLEGVARRRLQAEILKETIDFYERKNPYIIFLDLSIESARARVNDRGRTDDTAEGALERRFAWFQSEVLPALEYLGQVGFSLKHIDGEPSPEEIHKNVLQALGLT